MVKAEEWSLDDVEHILGDGVVDPIDNHTPFSITLGDGWRRRDVVGDA